MRGEEAEQTSFPLQPYIFDVLFWNNFRFRKNVAKIVHGDPAHHSASLNGSILRNLLQRPKPSSRSTDWTHLLPTVSLIPLFFHPGAHAAFSWPASCNLEHFLSLSLPVMAMALLKNASQSFWRMSLNMGLYVIVSWLDWSYAFFFFFWQQYHKSDIVPFLEHPVRRRMMSACLIIGDVSFHRSVKGASANTLFLSVCLSTNSSIAFYYCLQPLWMWWLTNDDSIFPSFLAHLIIRILL